jgi:hypothetical protein
MYAGNLYDSFFAIYLGSILYALHLEYAAPHTIDDFHISEFHVVPLMRNLLDFRTFTVSVNLLFRVQQIVVIYLIHQFIYR